MVYGSTTASVWGNWTTITTGTATTICDPWDYWIDHATSTATSTTIYTTTDTAWNMWVTGTTGSTRAIRPAPTPEMQATRRREQDARKELKQARTTKARRLLMAVLDARQQEDLNKHNYFYVIGGKTGHKYRIDYGRVGNVKMMVNDRVAQSWCAHPQINCPNEDTMLAQKVMLEHMEEQFKQTANITFH